MRPGRVASGRPSSTPAAASPTRQPSPEAASDRSIAGSSLLLLRYPGVLLLEREEMLVGEQTLHSAGM